MENLVVKVLINASAYLIFIYIFCIVLGSCPLCGAMLRQARNLRRHLITSCKYRTLHSQQTTTTTTQMDRPTNSTHLHELQTISVQNLETTNQSLERIDSKHMGLTPISCNDILSPSSNIITMQANNLQ